MQKVRIPWFPTYSRAQALCQAMVGVQAEAYKRMHDAIIGQMGTPQNPVDWSDPDTWISERLHGPESELAKYFWSGNSTQLNPRYTGGEMALARGYGLLEVDSAGKYQLTARGQAFVAGDSTLLQEIDEQEGITQLLSVLATLGTAQRKDIVKPWMEAVATRGDNRSQGTMESKLYDRMTNALERGLIEKQGIKYALTKQGEKYATTLQRHENSAKVELDLALRKYRDEQHKRLRGYLGSMHPYRFEHLIKTLLQHMGYSNVEVTKQSGDGGIDVVADFSSGLTSFREAIQVKRVKGTVGSEVVNSLRGSLHNAKALKGSIFTIGTFSKAARDNAAPENVVPITLVDGEQLIELLLEHSLGVSLTQVTLLTDIDEAMFSPEPMTQEEKEAELP